MALEWSKNSPSEQAASWDRDQAKWAPNTTFRNRCLWTLDNREMFKLTDRLLLKFSNLRRLSQPEETNN